MTDDITRLQLQNWNAIADDWSKHSSWHAIAFRPVVDWMIGAAGLVSGRRVLDVACGTGMPALAIAAHIHAGGSVVATDLSPDMLRVTAARARATHIRNMEFRKMDAHQLDFADESFDAVTCAFGLMFCHDPAQVLREAQRILKKRGRVVMTTWAPPAENSFITVYGRAVAAVLSLPRYDRAAPGPFRFTEPAELESLFNSAGFHSVSVSRRPQTVTYESVAAYHETSAALTPGLTTRLAGLGDSDTQRLRELVTTAAEPFIRDGMLQLSATPICISATR